MEETLQPQHECDEHISGYVEIKLSPTSGWILWVDDAPEAEINYCPYCGEKLNTVSM